MRGQLACIQHLRLLAAVFVLYGHTIHEATTRLITDEGLFDPPQILEWGMGVEIFFVISGFVMFLTSGARFGERRFAAAFLRRRLVRVAPMYWIFTTLMLVATLGVPGAVDHRITSPGYVASSYLFLPWPRGDAEIRPLLALGWTLNFEMFFYAVFSACLLLSRRWGPVVLASVLTGAAAVHIVIPERWWVVYFWTDPIGLEFLVGVGLAKLFQKGVRLPGPVAIAGAVLALMLAVVFMQFDLIEGRLRTGIPAALLAASWLLGPDYIPAGRISRALSFGGDASYALYLSHPFALNVVAIAWEALGLEKPWLFMAVSCGTALALAAAVHLVVERPLVTWLRDRFLAKERKRDVWRDRCRRVAAQIRAGEAYRPRPAAPRGWRGGWRP